MYSAAWDAPIDRAAISASKIVFKGPVHRTEKRPKTELDQTGFNRFFSVRFSPSLVSNRLQLPVAHFWG